MVKSSASSPDQQSTPAPAPIASSSPEDSAPANTRAERAPLDRQDRQIALIIAAATFALLLRTVAPDMLSGDPGEFQFAAWRLGLAHPTGYPLYLIVGWLWQHTLALLGANPAWALNAFSAFAASIGAALLYLSMAQWTPLPHARRRMVGIYSTVLLVGNLTYWSQAIIAEVYALHVVLMLALLLAVQRLVAAATPTRLFTFAILAGLALTHHALTLLWLPMLLLYWLLADRGWRQLRAPSWLIALLLGLLPLLLYAYIPLRSGPAASPWYHQPLGDGTLTLYTNDWASFWAFISGGSIGAGFRTPDAAWAQISQAAWLWRYHFGWVGLAMMVAGIIWLWRTRRYAILLPTLLYVIAQQIFNLFYDIGDILVYYIPLYLVGTMWAGFALAGLLTGEWRPAAPPSPTPPADEPTVDTPPTDVPIPDRAAALTRLGVNPIGLVVGVALILLALRVLPITSAQIDQSNATEARQQWEPLLAATGLQGDMPNAILVSNDRNEIVPLFYLQAVEGRAQGMTGLFPGIAPDARFTDIGTTLQTALDAGGDQPIYLVKSMPGLEVRFDLQPAAPPLVEVRSTVAASPTVSVARAYGPLQLLGYDFTEHDDRAEITLYWQPTAPIAANYVATAQLLTAQDRKITQDDHAPGGDYYPTSLWKVGETVVVRHTLPLAEPLPEDARLLVGFYTPDDLALLAQPITLELQ